MMVAMTDPTDADIVALMKLRGNGTREQPRTELGTPVGIAWRGVGIMEQDAQAAWDRHHAQLAGIAGIADYFAAPTAPDDRFAWDGNACRLSTPGCPLALLLEVTPSQARNEAGCDPMWWRWSLSLEINGIVEEIAEADDDVFGWAVAVEEVQVAARSFASSISAMVPTPFLPR